MRYFIDTEFIESGPGKPIQLVSIGIVSYLNEAFYAVSADFDPDSASDWVKTNVLAQLGAAPRLTLQEIKSALLKYISESGLKNPDGTISIFNSKPEFWGYYADYDWVVFCQIFGSMMDLPKGFPMYCRDIKQWCDELGNPKLPEQGKGEHNALADARWNKAAFEFLETLAQGARLRDAAGK